MCAWGDPSNTESYSARHKDHPLSDILLVMVRRILLALVFFVVCVVPVQAQETGWEIKEFLGEYQVASDATVKVTETVSVDFRDLNKHGIYRNVPVDYLDGKGNRRSIDLSVESVTLDGDPVPYEVSKNGREVMMKIGDANKVISGEHEYLISYEIDRVFNFFDTHDEFYWNVTGNEWQVPIEQVLVAVTSPQMPTKSKCFTGYLFDDETDCVEERGEATLMMASTKRLDMGQGMSVVLGYDKGVIYEPTWIQKIWWGLKDNWGYLIPAVTLSILMWLYLKRGRDNYYVDHYDSLSGEKSIPLFAQAVIGDVYYPPKNIQAAEAGLIIDEWVGNYFPFPTITCCYHHFRFRNSKIIRQNFY